ncbi:MAG: DNA replication/repair protein RecF [Bacteroidota bacterium]
MNLLHLRLTQFRAHTASGLDAAPGVNLLVGPNGAGKTNLLEALGYLCLGKSFLASSDQHAVQRGADHFVVEGTFAGEARPEVALRLAFVPGEGKRAFANGAPLERLTSLVGRVPLVVLSPADYDLTAGGPSERRRFLDTVLSQAYPVYLDDLVKYRRALRQRNALLQQLRRSRQAPASALDAWDEEIAVLGGRLMDRRAAFLDRFSGFVAEAYDLLDSPGGHPELAYAPSARPEAAGPEAGSAEDALRQALARTRRRGVELGRTLVGPHLDEVAFRLDGFDVRPYASQGQHRTFALAVRIAEALFFRDHLDEPPILLLDDVFGPLDPDRTALVLRLLASGALGQSFISAARAEPFEGLVPFESDDHARFHVEQGAVSPLQASLLPTPSPP